MTNVYEFNELGDMHYMYGEAKENAHAVAQTYRERYPGRYNHPHSTFETIHQRLWETVTLLVHKPDSGTRRTHTLVFKEVLRENPSTSTQENARAMGTNHVGV